MKKYISLLLIVSFLVTYMGSSFATGPGSPSSPSSPPMTQMNSAGLSNFRTFSNKVVDDHVDVASGAMVVNQTDLVIPGRNGLDLVISRTYNSKRFSTPPTYLSPAQDYFINLFNETTTEVVERKLTEEEKRKRKFNIPKGIDRLEWLRAENTEEVITRELYPKEIIEKEGDNLKSNAYSGFIGNGWNLKPFGSLMAISFSGDIPKTELPYPQVIVQYNGGSYRFKEGFMREGIYYSQEKGDDDFVRKTDNGYVLLKSGGEKLYFEAMYFERYNAREYINVDNADIREHEKFYYLSRIIGVDGNEISYNYNKFDDESANENKKYYSKVSHGFLFTYKWVSLTETLGMGEDYNASGVLEFLWAASSIINPIFIALNIFIALTVLFSKPSIKFYDKIGYKLYSYRLINIVDSCGRKIEISYKDHEDENIYQIEGISYLDNNGSKASYEYRYDDNNNLIEVIPPTGNSTKYDYSYYTQELDEKYDDKGYLLDKVIYPSGSKINYEYSWYSPKNDSAVDFSEFKEETEKDYSFYTVSKRTVENIGSSIYSHSGGFLFNSTRDNALAGVIWGFGDIETKDMLNRSFNHTLKGGRVVESENVIGDKTNYDWDFNNHNLRDIEAKRGSNSIKTQYRQYDKYGNFHVQIESGDDKTLLDDRKIIFEYEYEKNPVYEENGLTSLISHQWIEKNGKHKEVYFEYDEEGKGNLLKRVERSETGLPGQGDVITRYEYDSFGNVIKQIDPNGTITNFEYGDEYKNAYLTKVSKSVSNKTLVSTKSYYFNTGLLKSETDFNGNTAQYEYDRIGRMLKKTNPDNTFIRYSYNDLSNEISMTNENNQITTYKYDSLGRLKQVVFPDNKSAYYEYNAVSKVTSITDRMGRKTRYSYDDIDRIIEITYADGAKVEYDYDDSNNATIVSDSLGNATRYMYNNFGNLIDVKQANGERAMYDYDPMDNLKKMTDPRFLETKYNYDNQGRLMSTRHADGTEYMFKYDLNGNPIEKTDANGKRADYSYDELGRILKSEYQDPIYNVTRYYDEPSSTNSMGLLSIPPIRINIHQRII